MAEIKTKVTNADVSDFINSVPNEQKRQDGFTLLEMFTRLTGEKPKMWGSSIIGFGQYHYKSEKSRQDIHDKKSWPRHSYRQTKEMACIAACVNYTPLQCACMGRCILNVLA